MGRYKPRHAEIKAKRHHPRKIVAGVALGLAAVLGTSTLATADEIGHDISRWQGDINVNALGSFVIVKAGGSDTGGYYVDGRYKQKAQEVRNSGRKLGHYYYNGWADPKVAANAFVDNLAAYRPGDPLVYDAEESRFVSPAKVQAWVNQVRARLGDDANVYVYMSSSVTRAYNWSGVAASGVKLWVANYGVNNGRQNGSGPSVGYWDRWLIWQYTSVGRVSGYSGNLDTNIARNGAWGAGQVTSIVTVGTTSGTNIWGYGISKIQRLLNANGASLVVDGIQGSRTTAEIRSFQATHGLTVDGIVGPVTWAALNGSSSSTSSQSRAVAVQAAVGATQDGIIGADTTKRVNAVRNSSRWGGVRFPFGVRYTQHVVGTPVDGIWGRNSRAAHDATVRAIQRALGVTADGIWGTRTEAAWQAIR